MPNCAGPTRSPKHPTVRSTSPPRASRTWRGSRPMPRTCCRPSSSAWCGTARAKPGARDSSRAYLGEPRDDRATLARDYPRAGARLQPSPALFPRPDVHLEGPGAARLLVQLPVDLGDVVGVEDAVGTGIVAVGKIRLDPFGVDGAVDHDVGDMDVLGPQLARHRLRQRPHRM